MHKNLLSGGVALALILSLSPASSWAESLNSSIYLEVPEELSLYVPTQLDSGARALSPKMDLPEQSIIAIDLRVLNTALSAANTSPERVNFPYIEDSASNEIKRGTSWVCGLRVVDATDEDLREDQEIDRTDFCVTQESVQGLTALDSNAAVLRAAFDKFAHGKDLSLMGSVAQEIQRREDIQERDGLLFPIADESAKMISPLRDCGKGCLRVTSEFGMRNHPVLKKRRLHKGIDLRAQTGTRVVSVLPGKVLANRSEYGGVKKSKGKGKKKKNGARKLKGYGHYVIVMHPEANIETLYAHLSAFKSEAGASVGQGDLIALSGNTGIGTAPHLHFETHVPGKKGGYIPANPRTALGDLVDSVAKFLSFFNIYS